MGEKSSRAEGFDSSCRGVATGRYILKSGLELSTIVHENAELIDGFHRTAH